MRHSVTTVGMLREARAALEDEAATRPDAPAEPEPRTQPTTGRLAAVAHVLAHRARTLAARTT